MTIAKGDTVTVLVIEHRFGTNVDVFTNEEAALDSLWAFVESHWEDEIGVDVAAPGTRAEAIAEYFDEADEYFSVTTVTVAG
jgi:hypothetical protein